MDFQMPAPTKGDFCAVIEVDADIQEAADKLTASVKKKMSEGWMPQGATTLRNPEETRTAEWLFSQGMVFMGATP